MVIGEVSMTHLMRSPSVKLVSHSFFIYTIYIIFQKYHKYIKHEDKMDNTIIRGENQKPTFLSFLSGCFLKNSWLRSSRILALCSGFFCRHKPRKA